MLQSSLEFDAAANRADAAVYRVLHAGRRADAGHHDELLQESGQSLRPAWRRFFGLLGDAGADGAAGLNRRAEQVAQQIHRNGVTYNVYGAGGAGQRPWSLGLLPMLIEPADWRTIEAGVAQRARLLEAMLADCYGAQTLLREGLLPPALVLGHPGWIGALHGVEPPGGVRLHLAAFDIARGPDGAWSVVSQRTQAPSGLGYVLENRLIVSRQFPEAFRELRVEHLASGYRALLDTLLQLAAPLAAADGCGTPRLALLTPGPYNETYFEQAYLARYLGLSLVEGGDLTVRDERLYLKTVQGLAPIHGLLRRLDDAWCDPLELRADSALGVPGLLQVVRAGRVVVANALGAGFLESPGVQGFLPAIAERLFGEGLALPALPTWWCGEQAAWDATRDALGERVIRPTYPANTTAGAPARSFEPLIGATLDAAERAAWRARIDADPDAHTLQRDLKFSQTPWWECGLFQPRTAMLRVYAIAEPGGHGPRDFRVLPGGMTRIGTRDPHMVSMQHGGASLDTWVLRDGPVDTWSMLPQRLRPEEIAAQRRPVASRTAENLFWMGRYTERCEHLVRLALSTAAVVDDDADAPDALLDAVSELARTSGLAPWGVPSLRQSPRVFERSVVQALADAKEQHSVAYNLAALARSAGALRERLSPEHGRLVRAMAEDFARHMRGCAPAPERLDGDDGAADADATAPARGFGSDELRSALEHLAHQLAAVTGAQSDRMTRDDGWRLMTVGRLAERLIAMSGTLGVFAGGGALHGAQGFDLLLDLFDSTITYRARYPGRQEALALLDLLVLDEANPRALACVLRRLRTEVAKLPGGEAMTGALLALLPERGAIRLQDLCRSDAAAEESCVDDAAVVALAERLGAAGERLSDEIGRCYFAPAGFDEQHLAS
ncbi:MAG TPA: circularly permuted type 2 ATP-grasp protein [Methylibium sp.]|uniref:circularly permuted type 2 ATP-grasp protein n=1 Tax=Methylibium sp. TaxID=2067992 RepID=UPI002DB863CC|nr:circularly permuted type 2 ATP-grasp protein [Methylibium sp.]HEU4459413.1 circularly permuted type 2 ATP-grasp protein [Methylibium sp.]